MNFYTMLLIHVFVYICAIKYTYIKRKKHIGLSEKALKTIHINNHLMVESAFRQTKMKLYVSKNIGYTFYGI